MLLRSSSQPRSLSVVLKLIGGGSAEDVAESRKLRTKDEF